MKKAVFIAALISFLTFPITVCFSQDLGLYKQIVKELSSDKYQGRGYAYGGANKAGKYLEQEFRKAGVDEVALQPFKLDINTFPEKMALSVDGKKLTAGVDFVMREYSPGAHGIYPLYYIDTLNYNPEKVFRDLAKPENKGCMVVCDFWFIYKHRKDFQKMEEGTECQNAGMIYTWREPLKFYKAYGEKVVDKPVIWVSADFPKEARSITADIDNRFLEGYECFNVIAKVEGRRHDSCFVFTAHYDHLGNLGRDVFYPGANDNASGTACIVTLAAHYTKQRPEYDMYFIAFSGEDANLRGSEYYAEHPVVPLAQIKYLFNIDMIGDNNPVQYCEVSNEGMNGFALFERLNSENHNFKALNRGELAGNSDHYPFALRHVPCIFFENEEGDAFKYYHTFRDNYETFRIETYEPLFRLVTDFVEHYNRGVEGHYTYEHAFNYDWEGHHFDVSETGTMDFYADGTALDSARQVYTVTLKDGRTVTWVFNYISPSFWSVDGEDFHFGGISKESFRMEVIEGDQELELAQRIADLYRNGIDRDTKYHLDALTAEKLQWSLTYRDGHSDTWQFFRNTKH